MTDDIFLEEILKRIKKILPSDQDHYALHEPCFRGNEWNYVKECIDSGWVSSVGTFVDRFEKNLMEFTGVKRAVAVVNGTAALHICLKLVGVEPGQEVLLPTMTFVATANAVTYCGAIPHFIDCDEKTLGVDPYKLEEYLQEIAKVKEEKCWNKKTGRQIKALVAVHTFGHPVDLEPLVELSQRYHIELVEDMAESLGSYYKGRHTGNYGRISALSFNGNKIVTTGGGGAILTNDESLGMIAKHLTTTAKKPHPWEFEHDQIGYNYRMPNINAALGCAQLEQLPVFLNQKRVLAGAYINSFKDLEGCRVYSETAFARSNYWLNTLILDNDREYLRDKLLELTHSHGIMTRPVWKLLHKLPMFSSCPKMDVSHAESLERRMINLPSSPFLMNKNQ
jgi:perosamine synthetase